jgi:hypothetical protein
MRALLLPLISISSCCEDSCQRADKAALTPAVKYVKKLVVFEGTALCSRLPALAYPQ